MRLRVAGGANDGGGIGRNTFSCTATTSTADAAGPPIGIDK